MTEQEAIDWCEQFRDNIIATGVEKEKYTLALKAMRTAITALNNQVSSSKWISVKDRLPKMRDDGFADAFLVTNGNLAHIAYFVDGEWIFTDNGQMKEPMFYDVTHWLCLPQPPKGE